MARVPRILAIDGGGIAGLIPAMVLSRIEALAGRPAADLFDLIVGTSTGGLMAAALARPAAAGGPMPAVEIAGLYHRRGRDIFPPSGGWLAALVGPRYSADGLRRVIDDHLGEARLGACTAHTAMAAYDMRRRAPAWFRSWAGAAGVRLADAVLATTAAPTYFPPHGPFVDGGLFVNNPAAAAYAESRKLWPDAGHHVIVSLGTGEASRPLNPAAARGWGAMKWAAELFGIVADAQSDQASHHLSLQPDVSLYRYQIRLTRASDALDDASPGNLAALGAEATDLIVDRLGDIKRLAERLTR